MNDLFGGMSNNMSGNSSLEGKRLGVNLAKVVDLDDPDGNGRVKCEFITAEDDIDETEWAYIASPFAGNEYGFFFHPRVGDVVLLAYEDGDIHAPFVIGNIWWKGKNIDNQSPTKIDNNNKDSDIYTIKTPGGHIITLSDKKNEEKIEILSKEGHVFRIDDNGKKIEMLSSDDDGITLDTNSGEFKIKCKKFEVDADGHTFKLGSSGAEVDTSSKIELKSGGATDIKATGAATVEGSTFTGEAKTGTAKVSGSILNLEASGAANLKGSMVKLG